MVTEQGKYCVKRHDYLDVVFCATKYHKFLEMIMNVYPQTISIRLPDEDRAKLDRAIKLTRRSRSFLMKEALERHLDDVLREETKTQTARPMSRLLSLEGKGVRASNPRSREEIDQHIRWLRDHG
jgi:Arc/MetJ-type ribon-helix-helix transcriptional regulator